jgi:hypothetical protein
MEIALSVFGIAFVAFCVWLTVRIINRRERWAKWTLAGVVGLPLLYVLTMVLSFRMLLQSSPDDLETRGWRAYRAAYAPIILVYDHGPEPVHQAINLLCLGSP